MRSVHVQRLALGAIALLLGCGSTGEAPSPGPSGSARAAPSASASAAPISAAPLGLKRLARKTSPIDLRTADEKACVDGKPDACRRMADRHRGYGLVAGCGVARARERPFIKRVSEDTDEDARQFEHFIRRACELGDGEACAIAKRAPSTYSLPTDVARRRAARSRADEVGVLRYRQMKSPDLQKVLTLMRDKCIDSGSSCWDADLLIFKRDQPKPGAERKKLGPDDIALVTDLCKETHDCAEIMMMLDKNGHTPEELAPVRTAFADILTGACLEGECACGQASRYLASNDPTQLDLAILGCDDGDAEGCYELGRHYEEGVGVTKDPEHARSLYEVACPPARPQEFTTGPRLGEYSARACDRLADLVSLGQYPPKPFAVAMYYAQFACIHPGYEIEQAPCVRLGRFWGTNPIATGHAISDARDAAEGAMRGSESESECNRPSVKAECEAFKKAMLTVR